MTHELEDLALLALIFLAFPSSARWIEAQGTARIVNGDVEKARQQAIENALQQALLFLVAVSAAFSRWLMAS